MHPVKVERETNTFKKPKDWDDERQLLGVWPPIAEMMAQPVDATNLNDAAGIEDGQTASASACQFARSKSAVQPPLAVRVIAGVDEDDQDRRERSKSP